MTESSTAIKNTGIRIIEIRIRNFRSLKSVDLVLNRITLLIGPNNSGKTSLLEALNAAMGAGKRVLSRDDIYLTNDEASPPIQRSIIIDILIRPTGEGNEIIDSFPEGSYWLNLWRNGISQDEQDNDFMAFRTKLSWDSQKGEYNVERNFLREWILDTSKIEAAEIKSEAGVISSKQIEPMSLHFMDAKRDIDDDMRHQGSFWRRMTNDIGLSDSEIAEFEKQLSEINESIVGKSDILKHVKTSLYDLNDLVSSEKESVELAPVARKLRDLTKGIDVNFTTSGAQTFPLNRHGMGTRSMASILVFRAYMNWRSIKAEEDAIHPFLALEEPEAHLHPQAQRALFNHLMEIPGQIIISSHSPYVVAHSDFQDLRHLQKAGPETILSSMDLSGLDQGDLQKMKWKVLNTRGDMLFANALILFEGESEEQAFGNYANEYLGKNANELGLNLISVGGGGGYLPFLRLAEGFGIRWYIFSDGEKNTLKNKLASALKGIGIDDYQTCEFVFTLPDGLNLETYLLSEGYSDAIENSLNKYHGTGDYIADYISRMNNQSKKGGGRRNYKNDSDGGRQRALTDILKDGKTRYSEFISLELLSLHEKNRRVPKRMCDLFHKISYDLGL